MFVALTLVALFLFYIYTLPSGDIKIDVRQDSQASILKVTISIVLSWTSLR